MLRVLATLWTRAVLRRHVEHRTRADPLCGAQLLLLLGLAGARVWLLLHLLHPLQVLLLLLQAVLLLALLLAGLVVMVVFIFRVTSIVLIALSTLDTSWLAR